MSQGGKRKRHTQRRESQDRSRKREGQEERG
jgi:hypothetical protein